MDLVGKMNYPCIGTTVGIILIKDVETFMTCRTIEALNVIDL